MVSKELQQKIENKYIIPYLLLLRDGLYLIIYDKNDDIIGRFVKSDEDGKIYEIHNVLFTDDIEDYLSDEVLFAHSVLFRNNKDYELNKYVICERKEYISRCKEFIKKIIDTVNSIKKPNTYTLIMDSIERDGGKYVTFDHGDSKYDGILVAACDSDEDIYWVVITNELKIQLESAVGGYHVIEDKKQLKSMNKELKSLQENKPEELVSMVENYFKNKIDYVFTKIKVK